MNVSPTVFLVIPPGCPRVSLASDQSNYVALHQVSNARKIDLNHTWGKGFLLRWDAEISDSKKHKSGNSRLAKFSLDPSKIHAIPVQDKEIPSFEFFLVDDNVVVGVPFSRSEELEKKPSQSSSSNDPGALASKTSISAPPPPLSSSSSVASNPPQPPLLVDLSDDSTIKAVTSNQQS